MKRLAAAVLVALALSGCAVTGQSGAPSTVASVGETVITTQQVADWTTAQLDMGFANPDASSMVTLRLLEPTILAAAKEGDYLPSDAELTDDAKAWAAVNGVTDLEVTPDMLSLVRAIKSLGFILTRPDGAEKFFADVEAVLTSATVSPLYGTPSIDTYMTSLQVQAGRIGSQAAALAPGGFYPLKDTTGFNPAATPSWMTDGSAS